MLCDTKFGKKKHFQLKLLFLISCCCIFSLLYRKFNLEVKLLFYASTITVDCTHTATYCIFPVQCFCELEKSQWLFPYKDLKFEGELGSGAFGVVRKAQALSMQLGNPSTTVAVKTLKGEKKGLSIWLLATTITVASHDKNIHVIFREKQLLHS